MNEGLTINLEGFLKENLKLMVLGKVNRNGRVRTPKSASLKINEKSDKICQYQLFSGL